MRLLLWCAAMTLGTAGFAADPPKTIPVDAAPAEPWKPAEWQLPAGFEAQVVAAPPLVEHPIMASFDDRGRLYVAESTGANLKFDELQKARPHSIRRLEDTDGDGRFDRFTLFADQLEFPQGALWHDGALYVASPPYIWKFEDADDDGVAEKRTPLVGRFGSNGNAADIHGCYLSPTGRVYWADGFHGHDIDQPGSPKLAGKASYIFSCKPDGTDVQRHCVGGMDNPVEMDWTDEGELLGVVNILLRQPRVDCLVHWMHGGMYPHREAARAEGKLTGDWMPPLARYGHIAVSGMMIVRGDALGPDLSGNVLVSEFNSGKIVRSQLRRQGSTYVSRESTLFAPRSPDVHVTDVLQDADGSLLLIDTGGWFRIGCPTSQVAKPSVLGGIYRVTRSAAAAVDDPRGVRIDWNAAAERIAPLLDDPRFAVRDKAMAVLARRGGGAVAAIRPLLGAGSTQAKRNALWTLARIATPEAMESIRAALGDPDASVRHAAVRTVSDTRDPNAAAILARITVADQAPLRREAATALGRIGDKSVASSLLQSLSQPVDRLLEHAAVYALIELNDPRATAPGLKHASPSVRKGALIALDQMDAGDLTPDTVFGLLDDPDAAIRQAAIDIVNRRAGWASRTNSLLHTWLKGGTLDDPLRATVRAILPGRWDDPAVRELVGRALAEPTIDRTTRLMLLESIASAQSVEFHSAWKQPLEEMMTAPDAELAAAAISAAATVKTDELKPALRVVGADPTRAPLLRVAAMSAGLAKNQTLDDSAFGLLVAQLAPGQSQSARLEASRLLAMARLSQEQAESLLGHFAAAGPLELPHLIKAATRGRDPAYGMKLADAIEAAPAFWSLRADQVRSAFNSFPDPVKLGRGESLFKKLNDQANQKEQRLAELAAYLAHADAPRGKLVFDSGKGACVVCHRIGTVGGLVGPDLSAIGRIRTERDLLEAIAYPSASFARSYEPWMVSLNDGQVHMGTIPTDSTDTIQLMTLTGAAMNIPRANIKSMTPAAISIMPVGLDHLLGPQDLADLVAYLRSLQ